MQPAKSSSVCPASDCAALREFARTYGFVSKVGINAITAVTYGDELVAALRMSLQRKASPTRT